MALFLPAFWVRSPAFLFCIGPCKLACLVFILVKHCLNFSLFLVTWVKKEKSAVKRLKRWSRKQHNLFHIKRHFTAIMFLFLKPLFFWWSFYPVPEVPECPRVLMPWTDSCSRILWLIPSCLLHPNPVVYYPFFTFLVCQEFNCSSCRCNVYLIFCLLFYMMMIMGIFQNIRPL